jgi:UDP-glucose 4-epimerase
LHNASVVIARLSAVFGPWERDTGVRDSLSPMLVIARAHHQAATRIAGSFAPRNWLYSRDAAAALCGLALAPELAHELYHVTPTDWSEPMQWAHHLGFEIADAAIPDEEAVVELGGDSRRRAPMANDRIRALLPDWPAHGPEEAFSDYAEWLRVHETT